MRTLIAALLFLATLASSRADLPEWSVAPRLFPSSDSAYVFVMLSDVPPDVRVGLLTAEDTANLARYPSSGLYRIDVTGPENPAAALWTVDWHSRSGFLVVDSLHLVEVAGRSVNQELPHGSSRGLAFYRRGELLRSYRVRDLVEAPGLLTRSSSGIYWVRSVEIDGSTLTLWTLNLERYSFDATTGEMLSHFTVRPLLWFVAILAALGFVVVVRYHAKEGFASDATRATLGCALLAVAAIAAAEGYFVRSFREMFLVTALIAGLWLGSFNGVGWKPLAAQTLFFCAVVPSAGTWLVWQDQNPYNAQWWRPAIAMMIIAIGATGLIRLVRRYIPRTTSNV